jgi:uncharacterized membrane protein YkoI
MILPTVSRRLAGLVLAVAAGTGIALGAYSLGSASGAEPARTPHTAAAAATASAPPSATSSAAAETPEATATTSAAAPLTLDQAKAVATRAAGGGRVVEASEDNEPTGLLFDVTVLHPDGSATKVEVDAATGRIVSIKQDDHWD